MAKALAKKALSLVSLTGQPISLDIHKAKQHLNRWAEDASLLYAEGSEDKIPESYVPLLRAGAKMYMRCAEPLNWAWHISRLRHRHISLDELMEYKDARNPLVWHQGLQDRPSGRVQFMVHFSEIRTSTGDKDEGWECGSLTWREPCREFWNMYCDGKYDGKPGKVDGKRTCAYTTGPAAFVDPDAKCCQLYKELVNELNLVHLLPKPEASYAASGDQFCCECGLPDRFMAKGPIGADDGGDDLV